MTGLKNLLLWTAMAVSGVATGQDFKYRDCNLSVDERVLSLLENLTLEEKISLLGYNSPVIERLQIADYNWWNEGLHGVARAGQATVFPQAIALAATFDSKLAFGVADAISTEARAKFNLAIQNQKYQQYLGINFWTPNVNIFRDPRWGRGQETYGEDPYLTSMIGVSFVKGLQGTNPNELKVSACAKHFAVHSGPEALRHSFDAQVDEKDLRETYLPAFKALVESGVESIMCAYNRVNSEPCCISETLVNKILKNEWRFNGQLVTDCWALDDIFMRHKVMPTGLDVAVAAVKTGVNLDCSNLLQVEIGKAVDLGLITEQEINRAIEKSLRIQIRLGLFNNPDNSPYTYFGADSINNAYHVQLARTVAQKSMVLLKNNGVLPIDVKKVKSILVTGENAASLSVLAANYHGLSGNMVTFAEGIVNAAGPSTVVQYDMGCIATDTLRFGGIWAASMSDITVAVIGLNPLLEGEDGDAFLADNGGDRNDLNLPRGHVAFLKKLRESNNKPIIVVITAGSAVDVAEIEQYADAVILAWYPGEQGGNAFADLMFGKISPSGRLPITFYRNVEDLPDYADYSMKNRTYRYFNKPVLYPFGYGLSYTSFDYQWVEKPVLKNKNDKDFTFSLRVANSGAVDSDEVVQVYIEYPNGSRMPLKELKGFSRVHVIAGENQLVSFRIATDDLKKWDSSKSDWVLYKGIYKIHVSKNSNEPVLSHAIEIK